MKELTFAPAKKQYGSNLKHKKTTKLRTGITVQSFWYSIKISEINLQFDGCKVGYLKIILITLML